MRIFREAASTKRILSSIVCISKTKGLAKLHVAKILMQAIVYRIQTIRPYYNAIYSKSPLNNVLGNTRAVLCSYCLLHYSTTMRYKSMLQDVVELCKYPNYNRANLPATFRSWWTTKSGKSSDLTSIYSFSFIRSSTQI